MLLMESACRDDNILPARGSCKHTDVRFVTLKYLRDLYNEPVPLGICIGVSCTSLRLTAPQRNRTLWLFGRGAKLRLDVLRTQ
jgi:hypothetical protein